MRAAVVAALLALMGGCAPEQYVYQPAVPPNSQVAGLPAVDYQIPPGQPQGNVRVASFGITQVQSQQGQGTPVLQVRMVVTNNSRSPWYVDTRTVLVSLGGEGRSRPAFVNTDAGTPPYLQVPAGQTKTIDLYYPLPVGMANASEVPAFDVTWQVQTPVGNVAQRTPFQRTEIEEYAGDEYGGVPYDYGYYGYPGYPAYACGYGYPYAFGFGVGLGPFWWYDPFYRSYGFYHHPHVFVGPGYHGRFFVGHGYGEGFYGHPGLGGPRGYGGFGGWPYGGGYGGRGGRPYGGGFGGRGAPHFGGGGGGHFGGRR
jgi:acidic type I keratin